MQGYDRPLSPRRVFGNLVQPPGVGAPDVVPRPPNQAFQRERAPLGFSCIQQLRRTAFGRSTRPEAPQIQDRARQPPRLSLHRTLVPAQRRSVAGGFPRLVLNPFRWGPREWRAFPDNNHRG